MVKFLYIHAIHDNITGVITFFHTSFSAVNEEQTYSLGYNWKKNTPHIVAFEESILGFSANDLVIRV